MNFLETRVGLALKIADPMLAILMVKESKISDREKVLFLNRILGKVQTFPRRRSRAKVFSLLEIFWFFWGLSDLDRSLFCLRELAKCELSEDMASKLELATKMYLQLLLVSLDNT